MCVSGVCVCVWCVFVSGACVCVWCVFVSGVCVFVSGVCVFVCVNSHAQNYVCVIILA